MHYTAINIQGNIISSDVLNKIRQDDLKYQKPQDFDLNQRTSVRDEIGIAWAASQAHWKAFKMRRDRLSETDTGTSETRQSWVIPMMRELGYDLDKSNAEIINEKTYAISHRAVNRDGFPVHIVGVNQSLDKRAEGGARLSPHGLVQEYINNHDHLYGIATNGVYLRLLRDATRLAKLTFLEFNLEQIMEEELYAEYALLFRLLHATRMPEKQDLGAESIIEYYHQEAIASGTRIRERLSSSVTSSLQELANGLLEHPKNGTLRELIANEKLPAAVYFSQLLRLVYRLLFLLVIEERNLLYPQKPDEETRRKRDIYTKYYSLHRLTRLAQSRGYVDPRKTDLWEALMSTFRIFENSNYAKSLNLQALGSGIFAPNALQDIKPYFVNNENLLKVLKYLTTVENENKLVTVVNYADLDVEEFGSVYEGLLDLNPYFQHRDDTSIYFGFSLGTDRKETGSYYTNHDLVAQLIKSSLDPLIEERLKPLETKQERVNALLSIKVCDPACGSGHFLLAAARRLALRIAMETTGEENPGKEPQMEAMRMVIQHCIYGVDKNPAAVELCKVALWIEGHSTGKPLSFLNHRIRPGDSLVGIDKIERLKGGIPDGAFNPVSGDDKPSASALKKANKAFRKSQQFDLFLESFNLNESTAKFAENIREIDKLRGDTIAEVEEQAKRYQAVRGDGDWWKDFTACNLFTYAFYQDYQEDKKRGDYVNSQFLMQYIQSSGRLNARLEGIANAAGHEASFFHWPLEFPEVFEKGGFDLMLGNPPWERIKLQEKEFFLSRDSTIANASNAAARKRKIHALQIENPKLYSAYLTAMHESEAASKFIRHSHRYPLTGRGDINTYSIFSEVIKNGINNHGAAGFIVPTGIATDDTNKFYFADLIESGRLLSLFDFENKRAIFENVHRSYKFCLLSLGSPKKDRLSTFGFFLLDVLDLQDSRRVFTLSKADFLNINPNTKTTPIFRTRKDAELTAEIYSRVPVLINEEKEQNPWGVSFMRMFDMSNDSNLFRTEDEMRDAGFTLKGNRFVKGEEIWLPLYESKMIWHYDHRFGTYKGVDSRTSTQTPTPTLEQYQDPEYIIKPWYWLSKEMVEDKTKRNWFLGFRDITNTTNERTVISSLLGLAGVGHTQPLIFVESATEALHLNSILSSLMYDFIARQKIGGTHLTYGYFQQLATSDPRIVNNDISKAFELIYTSWDLKAFADDIWTQANFEQQESIREQWHSNHGNPEFYKWEIPEWADAYPEIEWEQDKGCPLPPFKWDEERRAKLKAELDAYFALLYGLGRDDLRYILDPKEVYGKDFPGETFRGLKNKDIKKYGEYRTRRLVLEAYDRLRPSWDMEAHLAKLKEAWEECQVDLSKSKKGVSTKKDQKKPENGKVDFGLFGK